MAKSTPLPEDRANWWHDLNSYLFSAVCHLLAFLLLAFLVLDARRGSDPINLEVQFGDGNDVFAGDEGRLPGEEELGDTALESLATVEPEQLFEFEATAPAESEAIEVPVETLAAADATINDEDVAREVDRSLEAAIGHGGAGLGEAGDGADAWSGSGSPFGKEKGFFGIGDSGKSFVYVVDCSDSMNERNKFRRAKEELVRSLEQLQSDQRFFVIFFSDGAYPMDADETVEASPQHVAETSEWIDYVQANGGTNPLPALIYALALKPDAIYFLTDGQFDPQTILELRARNRASKRLGTERIPIHTITFVDRRAEGLMKTISRHSGGKYRFVK